MRDLVSTQVSGIYSDPYSYSTESLQGSSAPSYYLNRPELPPVGKHNQEHCESPVLGWPKYRSDKTAMVDHLSLNASQEAPEDQKLDPSRYGDSGVWEKRHTLGTPSPHALG